MARYRCCGGEEAFLVAQLIEGTVGEGFAVGVGSGVAVLRSVWATEGARKVGESCAPRSGCRLVYPRFLRQGVHEVALDAGVRDAVKCCLLVGSRR